MTLPSPSMALRALVLAAGLAAAAAALAIDTETAFPDPGLQGRYEALIRRLRCVQCQNQTIADSQAGVAADLRRQVREMIAAGQSDAAIEHYMTERYGDFVLYDPPLTRRTLFLWAAPGLFVLIGVGAVARVIVRRSRAPIGADEGDAA